MLVATRATVTVHVGRVASVVHVGCTGIADGISVATVAGSEIGALVSLGIAVTVPGLMGVTVCVLVALGFAVAVPGLVAVIVCVFVLMDTVLVLVGGGVEDGASVDSGTGVTGLVGFGLAVLVGIGPTVWVAVLIPAGTKSPKVTLIDLFPGLKSLDMCFVVIS